MPHSHWHNPDVSEATMFKAKAIPGLLEA